MTNKDASEILTQIKNTPQLTWTNGADVAFDLAIKALEERPQGKWIFHKDYNERKYGCNQCGNLNNIPSNFCPNCGVDLRKEADNDR